MSQILVVSRSPSELRLSVLSVSCFDPHFVAGVYVRGQSRVSSGSEAGAVKCCSTFCVVRASGCGENSGKREMKEN